MSRVHLPALFRLLLCAALLGALGKHDTMSDTASNPGTTSSFSGYIIAVG